MHTYIFELKHCDRVEDILMYVRINIFFDYNLTYYKSNKRFSKSFFEVMCFIMYIVNQPNKKYFNN